MENKKRIKSTKATVSSIEDLTINVKGLALVYKKGADNMVNLRLPIAADHTALITIISNIQVALPVPKIESKITTFSIPVGGIIEITHIGATSKGGLLLNDKIFKMNGLHSTAKFKAIDELVKVSSFVSVTKADFSPLGNMESFEKWKITDLPLLGKPRGRREFTELVNAYVSITGKVSFDPSPTPKTQIRVILPVDPTSSIIHDNFTITLGHSNATHIINITNLCDSDSFSCQTKSDFLEYYKVLDKNTMPQDNEFDFNLVEPPRGNRAPCNVAYFDNDPEP